MEGIKIGEITHFFDKLLVGIIKLDAKLVVGDKIKIKGATTDFEQEIKEMQYEHQNIPEGSAGQEIGIKVKEKVRVGDVVYKI